MEKKNRILKGNKNQIKIIFFISLLLSCFPTFSQEESETPTTQSANNTNTPSNQTASGQDAEEEEFDSDSVQENSTVTRLFDELNISSLILQARQYKSDNNYQGSLDSLLIAQKNIELLQDRTILNNNNSLINSYIDINIDDDNNIEAATDTNTINENQKNILSINVAESAVYSDLHILLNDLSTMIESEINDLTDLVDNLAKNSDQPVQNTKSLSEDDLLTQDNQDKEYFLNLFTPKQIWLLENGIYVEDFASYIKDIIDNEIQKTELGQDSLIDRFNQNFNERFDLNSLSFIYQKNENKQTNSDQPNDLISFQSNTSNILSTYAKVESIISTIRSAQYGVLPKDAYVFEEPRSENNGSYYRGPTTGNYQFSTFSQGPIPKYFYNYCIKSVYEQTTDDMLRWDSLKMNQIISEEIEKKAMRLAIQSATLTNAAALTFLPGIRLQQNGRGGFGRPPIGAPPVGDIGAASGVAFLGIETLAFSNVLHCAVIRYAHLFNINLEDEDLELFGAQALTIALGVTSYSVIFNDAIKSTSQIIWANVRKLYLEKRTLKNIQAQLEQTEIKIQITKKGSATANEKAKVIHAYQRRIENLTKQLETVQIRIEQLVKRINGTPTLALANSTVDEIAEETSDLPDNSRRTGDRRNFNGRQLVQRVIEPITKNLPKKITLSTPVLNFLSKSLTIVVNTSLKWANAKYFLGNIRSLFLEMHNERLLLDNEIFADFLVSGTRDVFFKFLLMSINASEETPYPIELNNNNFTSTDVNSKERNRKEKIQFVRNLMMAANICSVDDYLKFDDYKKIITNDLSATNNDNSFTGALGNNDGANINNNSCDNINDLNTTTQIGTPLSTAYNTIVQICGADQIDQQNKNVGPQPYKHIFAGLNNMIPDPIKNIYKNRKNKNIIEYIVGNEIYRYDRNKCNFGEKAVERNCTESNLQKAISDAHSIWQKTVINQKKYYSCIGSARSGTTTDDPFRFNRTKTLAPFIKLLYEAKNANTISVTENDMININSINFETRVRMVEIALQLMLLDEDYNDQEKEFVDKFLLPVLGLKVPALGRYFSQNYIPFLRNNKMVPYVLSPSGYTIQNSQANILSQYNYDWSGIRPLDSPSLTLPSILKDSTASESPLNNYRSIPNTRSTGISLTSPIEYDE